MQIFDQYDQVKALTAIIIGLADSGVWSEQQVMETLLEILNPSELKEMGYKERVEAYTKEYW